MSTPSRKVSLSSSSSLVNSLARRFDPHALKHQGPGPSISTTPITTDRTTLSGDNSVSPEGQDDMHRKFDFLSQKIEQLLTAQDKVLKTLGRVSHDVDGITKSMTTSKIEKEGPACEVRRAGDHLETKMLCLEMNQALLEMNKRTEQQVKRMDGLEQVVQGVQQFISFLAEKLKTSKIMEVLLNGPATPKAKPAKEVRTPKGDKAKKAGRGQNIADKKDVLPNKRKEKASREHKVKEKKEKSYLCLKGTHSLKKKPPDSAERFTQKLQACSHELKKDNAEKATDLLVQSSGLNVLTTGQKEKVEALAFTNQVEQSTPSISDDSDDYILHEEETSDQEGTAANESDHIDLVHAAEDVEGITEDGEVEGSTEELEGEKTADNEVQSRSSGTPAQEEELKSAVVFDKKEQHEDCLPEDQHSTSADETQIPSYSTTDTKDQEITPPDVIFEGGNLNCTVLLERYDDVGQEISLLLTVDNDVDREFSESPEQNCQLEHSGSSSKRRVTEDDSIKDDNKKSRVDKELSPVDSTDGIREPSHALFIQAADSGDAESTDGCQQEIANEDNDDEFGIVECPAQAAPFGHRIVSARHAQINNHYIVNRSEIIGGGRFGQVYLCTENLSGLTLAAKVIKAKFLKQKEEVKNEINVMNQLNHSNLIQLYDAFESKNDIVLVMEYIAGGELFDRIIDETYRLTEMDTILFIKQICDGIQYMHQMYIVHLDLKPENIMCVNRATNQIKIIDFGLARRYKPREKLKVNFGTPEFLAPEVVNYEFVSFPTDMWSIGVIAYMLLSGLSPFMGEDDNETMNNIICCRWGFENDEFSDVSEDAKDFITKLLIKDKSWRISAKESLKHSWLCDSELHSRLDLQKKTKGNAVSQAPMSQ